MGRLLATMKSIDVDTGKKEVIPFKGNRIELAGEEIVFLNGDKEVGRLPWDEVEGIRFEP